ncbi:MAG: transcriptional regulator [Gammaproteobacteria bacterium]|nr:MAG: transcriptional regulator [Gammaproteobacteria bacterium]UTW42948.1 helix-turn-helix transcriptional regulator [bacterium SCSIO 12844]
MKLKDNDHLIDCPIEIASSVVGGKWKCVILFRLLDNTVRFNELSRSIDGITRRMLTLQLRELEALGIVNRKVYHQVPPKVEYSLTPLGAKLKPILKQLKAWGDMYIKSKN